MLYIMRTYIGADRLTVQKYLGYFKTVGPRNAPRSIYREGLFEQYGLAKRLKSGKGWLINVEMLPSRRQRKLSDFDKFGEA